MVKLYYTPTSCGAASFITAFKEGLSLEAEQVDLKTHKTKSGQDFYKINPKGNVPALCMDDGTCINENVCVLQTLGDMATDPQKRMMPESTKERCTELCALSFVASEVHPVMRMLFSDPPSEAKAFLIQSGELTLKKLQDNMLGNKPFLAGDKMTVADAYAYICLGWCKKGFIPLSLDKFPGLSAYFDRLASDPQVQEAHKRMEANPPRVV